MLSKNIADRLLPINPLNYLNARLRRLALAALLSPLLAWAQDAPQLNLQRTSITAGMHLIDAQVAQTPEQRQAGLMQRKEMPQREGMIFVFDEPGQQCFWMKNTLLPLTAAFVAATVNLTVANFLTVTLVQSAAQTYTSRSAKLSA